MPSHEGAHFDRRLRRQLSAAILAANVLGAGFVFGFLGFVVPSSVGDDPDLLRLNLYVFLPFMPLVLAVGTYWALRISVPARSWVVEGRAPDERERDITLRQPLRLARVCAVLWATAALVFGALNAPSSVPFGLQVAATILLGGLATCAMVYLLSERLARPLAALALAEGSPPRPSLPGVATRMVLAWGFGTGVAVLGSGLVAGAFLLGEREEPERLAAAVFVLSLVALLAGLATVVFAARSVADPLASVRSGLAAVEHGDLSVGVPVYDASEVGRLQAGFNRMVGGLRERERIRDLFGRHVGEDVARRALSHGLELGGEAREVAVLFVDIIGSTAFAASRDPAAVVAMLNRFFAFVVETSGRHGGWVNKFEGDAALCVFGAPDPHPDAASAALIAARELDATLRAEFSELEAAIGVSAGAVVAGNVGAAARFEYTVIGDAVNEAARLTDLAKTDSSRVLASEAIVSQASAVEAARWSLGEAVLLRGRAASTRIATCR